MRSELRPVVRALSARRSMLDDTPVYTGTAGSTAVTAAMIGVGPEAARRSTEQLLQASAFDHVVVSGIAGGIGPDVEVGDLMTPAAVEDLSTGRRFVPAPLGGHTQAGTIGTTEELILDEARLAGLVARGLVGLDMETAAVAEVCEGSGVPWSVFRVVSDRPQDGLLDDGIMTMLQADGTINARRALLYVATRPGRIGALARLARDSGGAARRAARAAVAACATLSR
jgi:adenosylhomocysteine nucleosidase